jgi:hypothetical protein
MIIATCDDHIHIGTSEYFTTILTLDENSEERASIIGQHKEQDGQESRLSLINLCKEHLQ